MNLLTRILVELVDVVSRGVFQITGLALLTLIKLLGIPVGIILQVPPLLIRYTELAIDSLLSALTDIAAGLLVGLLASALHVARELVRFLLRVVSDLATDIQTALQKLGNLVAFVSINLGKLLTLSLYRIWKNLVKALADLIQNL